MSRALLSALTVAFLLAQAYGEYEEEGKPCTNQAECLYLDEAKRQAIEAMRSDLNGHESELKRTRENLRIMSETAAALNFPVEVHGMADREEEKIHNSSKEHYEKGILTQKETSFFRCISGCELRGKNRLHEAMMSEIDVFKRENRAFVFKIQEAEAFQKTLSTRLTEEFEKFAAKINKCITSLGINWTLKDARKSFLAVMNESQKNVSDLQEVAKKYLKDVNEHANGCKSKFEKIAVEEMEKMEKC